MNKSLKKDIMSEKTEVLYVCEVIIQSSWFSVEFIWFIPILMLPSWFCWSYLFWASHRDETDSSDVIHSLYD